MPTEQDICTPYTLEELVTVFRQDVDDLPGDTVATVNWKNDDTGLLWKNQECARFANAAVTEYLIRNPILDQDESTALTRITVPSGTNQFDYDTRIQWVRRIKIVMNGVRQMVFSTSSGDFEVGETITDDSDSTITGLVTSWTASTQTLQYTPGSLTTDFSASTGGLTGGTSGATATAVAPTVIQDVTEQLLNKASHRFLDRKCPNWNLETPTDVGTPEYYVEDGDRRKLHLHPSPDQNGTLHMIVDRVQLAQMKWSTRHTDVPEVDPQHHDTLLHWMKHLAYRKQDGDMYDKAAADFHKEEFDRLAGPRPSARLQRVRRQERNQYRTVVGHYF